MRVHPPREGAPHLLVHEAMAGDDRAMARHPGEAERPSAQAEHRLRAVHEARMLTDEPDRLPGRGESRERAGPRVPGEEIFGGDRHRGAQDEYVPVVGSHVRPL